MTSNKMELAEPQETQTEYADFDSPGQLLKRVRIEKNVSIENVANQLHLRIKVIESIEQDDYANLPEQVFIRGYLRAYANYLALDADQVICCYNEKFNNNGMPDKPENLLWQNSKVTANGSAWLKWITVIAIVASIIAIALWWHRPVNAPVVANLQDESEQTISLPTLKKLTPVKMASKKNDSKLQKQTKEKKRVHA